MSGTDVAHGEIGEARKTKNQAKGDQCQASKHGLRRYRPAQKKKHQTGENAGERGARSRDKDRLETRNGQARRRQAAGENSDADETEQKTKARSVLRGGDKGLTHEVELSGSQLVLLILLRALFHSRA
jgi:hypothetical protein